ncbi:MAG TPA: hypothetical protein VLS89_12655, partial [Candidatus Nanopelagicales bacterium]|nr:hypothetical protein [Candidatus Nanopelagicales bacterium]
IELQVHEDVPLDAGGAPLVEIVVGRAALLSDLPDDLLARARVAAAENEVLASIAEGIAATVATASEEA